MAQWWSLACFNETFPLKISLVCKAMVLLPRMLNLENFGIIQKASHFLQRRTSLTGAFDGHLAKGDHHVREHHPAPKWSFREER
jgi:hypothetical protein